MTFADLSQASQDSLNAIVSPNSLRALMPPIFKKAGIAHISIPTISTMPIRGPFFVSNDTILTTSSGLQCRRLDDSNRHRHYCRSFHVSPHHLPDGQATQRPLDALATHQQHASVTKRRFRSASSYSIDISIFARVLPSSIP